MGVIRDGFNTTYANGPSGNPKEPPKSEIRTLGGVIEDAISGAAAGAVQVATWAELSAIEGDRAGQPGRVALSDNGTHTDPVVGGTVDNSGEYSWSASPAGWHRIADLFNPAGLGDLAAKDTVDTPDINNGAVTNAKQANMAAGTVKMRRAGAGTGAPTDTTLANLKTDLALSKGDVGLSNVDNTADMDKPISTAVGAAIDIETDRGTAGIGMHAINIASGVAYMSGTNWVVSWAGARGLFKWGIVDINAYSATVAVGEVVYVDLSGGTPYTAQKAANSFELRVDFSAGTKLLLLWNGGGGTLTGALAGHLRNAAAGDRIELLEGSENLFNKDDADVLSGYSLDIGGLPTVDAQFWTTHFIEVIEGEDYAFTVPATNKLYYFYGADKVYLPNARIASSGTITIPSGAVYVRGVARLDDTPPASYMFVRGSAVPSTYQEWNGLSATLKENRNVPGGYVGLGEDGRISPEALPVENSRNLFDKRTMHMRRALATGTGELSTNVFFFTTDFIRARPGQEFTFTTPATGKIVAFYDEDKVYISETVSSGSFTAPAFTAYLRLTARHDDTPPDAFMIVQGDTLPATYEPSAVRVLERQANKNAPGGYAGLDENGQLPAWTIPPDVTTSPLAGKVIAGLGDSITYGFIPRNAPGYPGQLNSFLVLLGQIFSASILNYGISGSTLGDNGSEPVQNSPMSQRFAAMNDDADLVILMGGTNDVRKSVPLGVMGDTTDLTYYGALDVLAQGLLNKYRYVEGGETRKIVFATPIRLLDDAEPDGLDANLPDYCQAVKDVAAKYAIPVFDAYNLSGLTPELFRTLTGTEPGYTDDYNIYVTDGTHPTQEGHRIFADAFAGFIRGLY